VVNELGFKTRIVTMTPRSFNDPTSFLRRMIVKVFKVDPRTSGSLAGTMRESVLNLKDSGPNYEVFSGDFTAATDTFNYKVAQTIFLRICKRFNIGSDLQDLGMMGLGSFRVIESGVKDQKGRYRKFRPYASSTDPDLTKRGTFMGTPLSWLMLSASHLIGVFMALKGYKIPRGWSKGMILRLFQTCGDDIIAVWPKAFRIRYQTQMRRLGFQFNDKSYVSARNGLFCEMAFKVISKVSRIGTTSEPLGNRKPTTYQESVTKERLKVLYGKTFVKFEEIPLRKFRFLHKPYSLTGGLVASSDATLTSLYYFRFKPIIIESLKGGLNPSFPAELGGMGLSVKFPLRSSFLKKVGTIIFGAQSTFPGMTLSSPLIRKCLGGRGVLPLDPKVVLLPGRRKPLMGKFGTSPLGPKTDYTCYRQRYFLVIKPFKGHDGVGPKALREKELPSYLKYDEVIAHNLRNEALKAPEYIKTRRVLGRRLRFLKNLPRGPIFPGNLANWLEHFKSYKDSKFLLPLVVPWRRDKDSTLSIICIEDPRCSWFLRTYEAFEEFRDTFQNKVNKFQRLKR
jgi:hypothetical protein